MIILPIIVKKIVVHILSAVKGVFSKDWEAMLNASDPTITPREEELTEKNPALISWTLLFNMYSYNFYCF